MNATINEKGQLVLTVDPAPKGNVSSKGNPMPFTSGGYQQIAVEGYGTIKVSVNVLK